MSVQVIASVGLVSFNNRCRCNVTWHCAAAAESERGISQLVNSCSQHADPALHMFHQLVEQTINSHDQSTTAEEHALAQAFCLEQLACKFSRLTILLEQGVRTE